MNDVWSPSLPKSPQLSTYELCPQHPVHQVGSCNPEYHKSLRADPDPGKGGQCSCSVSLSWHEPTLGPHLKVLTTVPSGNSTQDLSYLKVQPFCFYQLPLKLLNSEPVQHMKLIGYQEMTSYMEGWNCDHGTASRGVVIIVINH